MLAIFDSFIYQIISTTSTSIGVVVGVLGSHEVAAAVIKMIKWCQFRLFSAPCLATLMPSLTGQSCCDSLPAVCLARQVGAIYRPPQHPWMSDMPMNESRPLNFWNGIATHELLVYCCICRMVVKRET